MTICPKCNGYIGDINFSPFDGHRCQTNQAGYGQGGPITPPQRQPIKCAQCGSTTIDHTENECRINRQMPVKDKLEERLK